MSLFSKAVVLSLIGTIAAWASPFAVTEGVDFSNNIFSPSNLAVTLGIGTNTISGTVFRGGLLTGDVLDAMQFTKLASESISSIRITTSGYHGSIVPGSLIVLGAVLGATTVRGNGAFNVALTPGTGNTVTLFLVPPLVAAGGFNYKLEIVGTPEPATLAMFTLGGFFVLASRLRRPAA